MKVLYRKALFLEYFTVAYNVIEAVAATFFILGADVLYQSLKKLVTKEIPDPSLPGIILAVVSIALLLGLSLNFAFGRPMQLRDWLS